FNCILAPSGHMMIPCAEFPSEGWHNNHHAYQYSARHGLQWWEVDLTWMTIRLLQILGLATNIKLPPTTAVTTES
ncbi:MAG: hypothetical protein ACKO90_42345, partial [Microcystis panniformis]